jgi:hypothetical protein
MKRADGFVGPLSLRLLRVDYAIDRSRNCTVSRPVERLLTAMPTLMVEPMVMLRAEPNEVHVTPSLEV